jgi:uncharacterized protein with FMN-binding domain
MLKLTAVFAVIVIIVVLIVKPIEHESQMQHQERRQQQSLKQPPFTPPTIHGQSANVEGTWMVTPQGFSTSQVLGYAKHKRISALNVLHFTANPKEVRIENKSDAEMLRVEAVYSSTSSANHQEEHQVWKFAGQIARTKHITPSVGKPYQMELVEVYVQVHDPHFYSGQQAKNRLTIA